MEIDIYNPYDSPTLSERLLNRRPQLINRRQNSMIADRSLHRRQNRFRNLNRFGEQSILIVSESENLFIEFIKNDASIKIQRWFKRYNFNKKYIKSMFFIER